MANPIIKVENISKRYRIGIREEAADSVGGAITSILKSPFRNFRNLRNLTSFDKNDEEGVFWALKDISFELEKGDVLGVVGKNGAGKSTLLKLLSRITPPTTGRISVEGRMASLLEVGTGFHGDLTGRENVFLNGTILGMKKKEIASKFDEIVAFSGIEKFIDTPVKRYSSGMTVRLAFAVAAHLEPEIMIIDEVLAVGDAEFQKKCLGKMKDVAGEGKTVLFVSHNLTAVKNLCNKAILLKNGRLINSGPTDTVLDSYLGLEHYNNTHKEWPIETAPGTDEVKVLSASIKPISDTEAFKITVLTAVRLAFEFQMLVDNCDLHLSVLLYRADGEIVFNTFSKIIKAEKRVYNADFEIPANFLNDGNYTIELCVVKNISHLMYKFSEILSFEVLDLDREVMDFKRVAGVVRPLLNWHFPA